MNTKNKILKIICSLLFLLFVVLDINLLTTPVYNGTYKGTGNSKNSKIKFYDNTYTYSKNYERYDISAFGFYRIKDNTIYLKPIESSEPDERVFKRKNVFCFVSSETKYRCKKAMGLQVFYSIMKVSTASIVLTQIIKEKKQKR